MVFVAFISFLRLSEHLSFVNKFLLLNLGRKSRGFASAWHAIGQHGLPRATPLAEDRAGAMLSGVLMRMLWCESTALGGTRSTIVLPASAKEFVRLCSSRLHCGDASFLPLLTVRRPGRCASPDDLDSD
jgi:hypothetical protein